MIYRKDKYDTDISQLGFGCMRFTKKGSRIDYEKARDEIMHAIDEGINYFDTAYIYPGSEELLGRVLDENQCRDRVYIATKLPQYMMRSEKAIKKTFNEQLTRLRTDYVDYYLMHMFTAPMEWDRLCGLGIEDWIRKHKEDGSIRNIGFSFHGDTESFLKILDVYDWDFCQIQYNYIDEYSQAGRKGLMAAAQKRIPVIIMEPLRGGKLINIPEKAKEELKNSGTGYSPAELALRWLWDQSQVTCVLSGMNSVEMIDENIRIASETEPEKMTDEDYKLIDRIKTIIRDNENVGCTGCGYCMPCPAGVDIPGCFHYYNLTSLDGRRSTRLEFCQNVGLRENPGFPSLCTECGRCESHCPQNIEIRKKLKEADRELLPLHYKAALKVIRKVLKRR